MLKGRRKKEKEGKKKKTLAVYKLVRNKKEIKNMGQTGEKAMGGLGGGGEPAGLFTGHA